ncbi:MAG: hypothetical protein ACI396_04405 [Acutalibacteraceae bacterium]
MSYKTIEYTVYDDKIMPNTLQAGGVAGDDNAVRVKFDLNNITLAADDMVRIEISNGVGGFNSSEHLTVANGCVYYDLPFDVTSAGGTAVLHLVICSCKDNVEQSVRYSYPAKIYFEESGCGSISYKRYKQGLSGLALECKSYSDDAKNAADEAESAADEANQCVTAAQSSHAAAQAAADAAKASADSAASEIAAHNVDGNAHSAKFTIVQSQIDDKVNSTFVNEAVSAHNNADDAHEGLFNTVNSHLSGIDISLATAVEKGNATADTVELLKKYPCYEYATSGGAVQRFDDVSCIAHTIGITVHGATDDDGNSVTNPTVSVYGKNLCPINRAENTVLGKLNAVVKKGVTYTFSCLETYTDKGDDPAITTGGQFKINETGTSLGVIWLSKGAKGSFTFVAPEDGTLKLNMYNYVTLEEMQLEVGDTATDFEPYIEPQVANPQITIYEGEMLKAETFNAVSPTMTVVAGDDNGLVSAVDVTYNRDVGKAIAALGIS